MTDDTRTCDNCGLEYSGADIGLHLGCPSSALKMGTTVGGPLKPVKSAEVKLRDDYVLLCIKAGIPLPHRSFETVTYLLKEWKSEIPFPERLSIDVTNRSVIVMEWPQLQVQINESRALILPISPNPSSFFDLSAHEDAFLQELRQQLVEKKSESKAVKPVADGYMRIDGQLPEAKALDPRDIGPVPDPNALLRVANVTRREREDAVDSFIKKNWDTIRRYAKQLKGDDTVVYGDLFAPSDTIKVLMEMQEYLKSKWHLVPEWLPGKGLLQLRVVRDE